MGSGSERADVIRLAAALLADRPKGDAVERLRRRKLRRAGHPAPPARREPGGEYLEFETKAALVEYGYPEGVAFLVRTDVQAEPGDLVMVEREPFRDERGRVYATDEDENFLRVGILGRFADGSPRLESLTCGAYTYCLRRVVGVIVGPVAEPLRVVKG